MCKLCDNKGGFFWPDEYVKERSPYHPCDILYVRETWCSAYDGEKYFYFADKCTPREERKLLDYDNIRWHPSIHMPREAARIFLRVTDVWVERLQDISINSCTAEGVPLYSGPARNREKYYRHYFATLWNSTIKTADRALYVWNANPWVWVIEFERISKEETEQC